MSRLLKIGVLLLGVAVFCWGVQYKLSLYDVSSSAPIPAAKLLTGKSSVSLATPEVRSSVHPSALALVLLLVASYLSLSTAAAAFVRRVPHQANHSRWPLRAILVTFSFRPPPSFA